MAYKIITEIGHGGMGCVYRAQDDNGEIIALKMMSNKVAYMPEYRRLFTSEVKALEQMNHPSVVRIAGAPYSDAAGNFYLPMQYVEGITIEQHVNTKGTFSVDEAVKLMEKILIAMEYVHSRNCIHRDIKPSNIMIKPDGDICIIDFGIAKDSKIGSSGHTVGTIIGTNGYMSPEQANGLHIDHRTDIYSLGCLFYFLLSGKHAVNTGKNNYDTVANILKNDLPLPSHVNADVPVAVDNVYLQAVDKNMLKRYQNVIEFKEALATACGKAVPKITVGSLASNDIQYTSTYVSRQHLIIRGLSEPMTGGSTRYFIEITDQSTNGTGVNGCPLKHSTMRVEYNGTVNLPEVLLAAREECPLSWEEVVGKLRAKGWSPAPWNSTSGNTVINSDDVTIKKDNDISKEQSEKLNIVLGILSFLVPIVGAVLHFVWKTEHPSKAKKAGKLAIIGFVFGLIFNIIMSSL